MGVRGSGAGAVRCYRTGVGFRIVSGTASRIGRASRGGAATIRSSR